MFLLLLSLSLSLVGAQPTAERDCDSSDSCWGHPENGLATETRLASEERVLATLLCHLDCLDRGEDVRTCVLTPHALFCAKARGGSYAPGITDAIEYLQ